MKDCHFPGNSFLTVFALLLIARAYLPPPGVGFELH